MKTLQLLFCVSLIVILAGCEDDDNDDKNLTTAERIEGSWAVDEEDHLKSIKQTYRVYIDVHPNDPSKVLIDNFYGIDSEAIEASISGMTLTISEQETGDFLIRGSATISSNYKKLTWQYFVDDGSGIWTTVNAIYTKADY